MVTAGLTPLGLVKSSSPSSATQNDVGEEVVTIFPVSSPAPHCRSVSPYDARPTVNYWCCLLMWTHHAVGKLFCWHCNNKKCFALDDLTADGHILYKYGKSKVNLA